jgi:hypothetical protein
MPVKKVTSVMFGGPNLDILFVTSMAKPPLPRFPSDGVLRGSLFAIRDLGGSDAWALEAYGGVSIAAQRRASVLRSGSSSSACAETPGLARSCMMHPDSAALDMFSKIDIAGVAVGSNSSDVMQTPTA